MHKEQTRITNTYLKIETWLSNSQPQLLGSKSTLSCSHGTLRKPGPSAIPLWISLYIIYWPTIYIWRGEMARGKKEKAEWKCHQNIIPWMGRAISQQRQKWLRIPYFAVEETYLEWETTFPGSYHCRPGRAKIRTQALCSPGQESAAAYNEVHFCPPMDLFIECLLCAPRRELTLKWETQA